ncbi:MAG: asparagine synthase-related protein [Pseudomonadota bacterium]|nr:asparagine synthase-related protein [Pseudomonadota bacterium]
MALPLLAGLLRFDGSQPASDLTERLRAAVAGQTSARQRWHDAGGALLGSGFPVARPGAVHRRWLADESVRGWALAFDGRLTDREALTGELGLADMRPLPDDADLALAAFACWGEEAPRYLRGRFAIALWQGECRRLVMAVDPMHQASIYYSHNDGQFTFASSLRLLRALPQVPGHLDREMLALFIANTPCPQDRTIYAAIRQVPAATVTVIDGDGQRAHRYWRIDPGRRLRFSDEGELVEAARAVLDRAVARILPERGPVVVALSGGLDSTAIAATAARLTDAGRITALTTTPAPDARIPAMPSRVTNEAALARDLVAMHPGMRHEVVAADLVHGADTDPEAVFAMMPVPWRAVHGFSWYVPLCMRTAAVGAGAMLDGDGGNTLFSRTGLDRLTDLARRGHLPSLLREARALERNGGRPAWHEVRARLAAAVLPSWLQTRILRWRGTERPWRQASALRPELHRSFATRRWRDLEPAVPYRGSAERIRTWVAELQHRPGEYRPSIEHMCGIQIRSPFVDPELMSFFAAIPEHHFLRDGETRRLTRMILADRVPASVLGERRRGLQGGEWFHRMSLRREQIAADVEAAARSPLASELLDIPRLRRLVADWPEGDGASFRDYGAALARGVHVARFIRWTEGRND